MKRTELEQILKQNGYYFLRDRKHCIFSNSSNHTIAIPHHKEVNIFLAKKIIKSIQQPQQELKVA